MKASRRRRATTIKRPAHVSTNQRRAGSRKVSRRRAVAVPLRGKFALSKFHDGKRKAASRFRAVTALASKKATATKRTLMKAAKDLCSADQGVDGREMMLVEWGWIQLPTPRQASTHSRGNNPASRYHVATLCPYAIELLALINYLLQT
jgi:hypothetical protein